MSYRHKNSSTWRTDGQTSCELRRHSPRYAYASRRTTVVTNSLPDIIAKTIKCSVFLAEHWQRSMSRDVARKTVPTFEAHYIVMGIAVCGVAFLIAYHGHLVGAPLLDVHTAYPTPWQCSQQLDCLTDLSSEKQVCHMGLPHRVPAKQTSRRLGIAPVIDVGQLSVNKFPITRRKSTDDDPHTTPTAPLSSAVRAVHHFVTSNSLL